MAKEARIDIAIYAADTVKTLFKVPLNHPGFIDDISNVAPSFGTGCVLAPPAPVLSEWIAWFLVRTALPNSAVFHSLHLLRRVSARYSFSGNSLRSPFPSLFHHCLFLSSMMLAMKYTADDCYDNPAFTTAARDLFTLWEVNEMELTLFRLLNWQIRLPYEDLEAIVKEMEEEFEDSLEIERLRKKELERVREMEREKAAEEERRHLASPPSKPKAEEERARKRRREHIENLKKVGAWSEPEALMQDVSKKVRMVVKRTMSAERSTMFHGLRGVRLLTPTPTN
ncbi:hypothetical protein BT69DRAFT_1301225 [Atractiella rhizophila]|nr:hypothetical protein BT69DRAFT_1301225 [Atractiella rhizophila]